ncbi:MAG: VanZ family protein [Acidobacteriota bacterium]
MVLADNSKKRRERVIRYAPLLIWIGIIFFLSSNNGSMSETSLFIGPLLHFLFPNAPEATIQAYHGFIRKCAHFGVYFVLAVLAVRALRPMSPMWKFAVAIVMVAAIASLDEFNQSFEASRTSSAWDVALDCVGGVAGIAAATFIYRRFAKEPRQSVS